MLKPTIAIIGGSGLCEFPELKIIKKIDTSTPYGKTSDKITIARYQNHIIAFLPRHGYKHTIPPHKIPYKANLYALKKIGIKYIFATCIVGSLKKRIRPGTIVIPDQFINLTGGRDDYFNQDKIFIHLPMATPYCQQLREKLLKVTSKMSNQVAPKATVVVIQGPRFSTIAESKMYIKYGGDIVNMTQYPECYFAKEMGICYAVIASVTDYDVGLESQHDIQRKDDLEKVLRIFKQNIKITKEILLQVITEESDKLNCTCATNLTKPYYQQ